MINLFYLRTLSDCFQQTHASLIFSYCFFWAYLTTFAIATTVDTVNDKMINE